MEYTKGEWRATAFSIYVDDKRIMDAVVNDGNTELARVSIPELQANIELCAAAPELYEALKAMYKSWVIRPDDEVNVLIYKMAGQALAKAEGKS